ncbi:MAG: LppX_LprAFG lipoprotein [Streptomyces sp.]|nr:LppX_LprAFG lipoprotein [Streptomyces sp.]NUS14606.1 LppX_LprAFG lipoprotein [Streptomyces sp.]NUS77482.1 LppX_LprAFG lipoprotein [Streptomyces sp.]
MAPATAVARAVDASKDITSLHYRVTGTLPSTGRLKAEASMSTDPAVMRMTMSAADYQGRDTRMEVRFVDEAFYATGSRLAVDKLKGRSWVGAAPGVWGRGTTENQSFRVLPDELLPSPLAQLTMVGAAKDARRIGTETVDGARTTHYKGTVRYDDMTTVTQRDQVYGLNAADPITMDLWVDDDGRTKQFRVRATHLDAATLTEAGSLDLTFTFLDIDRPVTVEAPPADDTRWLGDAREG